MLNMKLYLSLFVLVTLCSVATMTPRSDPKEERVKIGQQFKGAFQWMKGQLRTLRDAIREGSNRGDVTSSLLQIRERINFFTDAIRRGVSIDELRAFKDFYIIGYSDAELAQFDKEIEEILASSDQGLDWSNVSNLPLEVPDLSNSQFPPFTKELLQPPTADLKEPHNLEFFQKKLNLPSLKAKPQGKDNVCFRPATQPLSLRHTSVIFPDIQKIEETEVLVNTITGTVTSTVVYPTETTITSTVVQFSAPQLLTSTVTLWQARFNTVETVLTEDAIKVNTVNQVKTERAVVYTYTPFVVTSPEYITTTAIDYLTDYSTVTLEHWSSSTMTFTETSAYQVSVTNTLTKSINVQRLVTETQLVKTMVPFISTIQAFSTVWANCPPEKGFLSDVKKWGENAWKP